MDEPRKLIRVTLREEFVVLTGDLIGALLLQQCLYWTESHKEYDDYLKEEERRKDTGIGQTYGWFRKSVRQITDQTLLKSKSSVADHLQGLINAGWLESRPDPHEKDRLQYRVKLIELQRDLQAHGFPLDGYTLVSGKGGMTGGETCPPHGQSVRHTDRVSVTRTAISEDIGRTRKIDSKMKGKEIRVSAESGSLVRDSGGFTGDVDKLIFEIFSTVHKTAPEVRQSSFSVLFTMLLQEQYLWERSHHVGEKSPQDSYGFHLKRFSNRYRSRKLLMQDLAYAEICRFCSIPCARNLDDRKTCEKQSAALGTVMGALDQAHITLTEYCIWVRDLCLNRAWALTPEIISTTTFLNDFLSERLGTCSSER